MATNRLGTPAEVPVCAAGWAAKPLVTPGHLIGANGLRQGPDKSLYVAQAFGAQISAIDLQSRSVRVVSSADDAIVSPDDVAFDSAGNLYATEFMNHRVSVKGPTGKVNVLAGDIFSANGLTLDKDRIFVSEYRQDGRILELHRDGSKPRTILQGLMFPNALSVGPDGYLYYPLVPLGEIWRVPVEGGEAELIARGLSVPTAVKFDSAGRLFSVEAGNGRLSEIDIATGSVRKVAETATGLDNLEFNEEGGIFVSSFADGSITKVDASGHVAPFLRGSMLGPYGLAATLSGTLFVGDGLSMALVSMTGEVNRPVMVVSEGMPPPYMRGVAAESETTAVFTSPGGAVSRYPIGGEAMTIADGLQQPMGLAIARDGAILVCEADTGCLLKIEPYGGITTVARGLSRPADVCIAEDGACFVTEADGGRIVHVSLSGDVTTLLSGLRSPHGVACVAGTVFAIDRATGKLYRYSPSQGEAEIIADKLPTDEGLSGTRQFNPGIPGLPMLEGPLLPFAGLAAMPDGSLCVGCDAEGSIWRIRPNEDAGATLPRRLNQ